MTGAPEGTLTISSLVDEVLDIAHGYVRQQEAVTSLTASMTDSALTFSVGKPNLITRGLVEIGDELVYVSSSDTVTQIATIEPWGRGQSGSVAEAHDSGTRVTISPLYPRQRIRSAIYETLREMFPDVWAVGQATIDVDVTRTNYPAESDAYQILEVEWHVPGPSRMWAPMKRWRENHTPTTLEIELMGPLWPGQATCRYRYMKTPPTQYGVTETDLSTYGYGNEVRDVIIYGTVARLLAASAAARTQIESMEAHGRAQVVQAGDVVAASRYYYTLFRERLAAERAQLMLRYPMKPHFVR